MTGPHSLGRGPAVQFFGPLVPKEYPVVQVAHQDGVASHIEESRLLPQLVIGRAKLRYVRADRDILVGLTLAGLRTGIIIVSTQ